MGGYLAKQASQALHFPQQINTTTNSGQQLQQVFFKKEK
jgi:hypothetical protein